MSQLTIEATEPKTYNVPEHRVETLEKKVRRYERRARKLGLVPFQLVKGEPFNVPVHEYGDDRRPIVGYRLVVPCQLIGSAPVLAGWRFVARIEHLGEAGNIIACAPSYHDTSIVPAKMRDATPTCDHCGTRRARKETFICQHEDGRLVRVGRSCLRDFVGTKDAAAATSIWALMAECESACDLDSDWGGCGSYVVHPETSKFVAVALRSVKLYGWVSRSGYYVGGPAPTADRASLGAGPKPKDNSFGLADVWVELQPDESDAAESAEALAWARSLDGSSDYEHNLKVAASLPCVTRRHAGILASIVVAYRRHQERKVERARRTKLGENSKHFGTVGRRYARKVTFHSERAIEGDFGVSYLSTYEDEQGNLLKWFASYPAVDADGKDLESGTKLVLMFTVKRHNGYNGVDETLVSRCKVLGSLDEVKWLGANGEVFKSRKALQAA
jgi:hypothetical protein